MLVVGAWVTSQIRDGVIRNSAATTALYVDSVIAPLLPDLRKSEELSESVRQALDETLGQGALGKRLVSFRLWRRDGTVLYAKDSALIGRLLIPTSAIGFVESGQEVRVRYDAFPYQHFGVQRARLREVARSVLFDGDAYGPLPVTAPA